MKLLLCRSNLLLILCVFFLLSGCSLTSKKSISTASINAEDTQKLNKLLLKEKYDISKDVDKKIIYLVSVDNDKLTTEKRDAENNGSLTFNIAKNKEFILSMPCGKNTLYQWKIDDSLDESLINLNSNNWIKPFRLSNILFHQDKYRHNFHMESLRTGTEAIKFTYYSQKDKSNIFNITINFEVE